MKRIAWIAAVVVLAWAAPASAMKIERVTSASGIEAWLVQEHGLPLITLAAAFKGGSRFDPEGKEGLAILLSGLLNEGAGDLDSVAFKRRLDELAIRFGASADGDNFFVSLTTLTENRDEAFRLLTLALTEPRFEDGAVSRVKSQMAALQQNDAEDPEQIAAIAWDLAMFEGHPYGRRSNGTAESIGSITADDLRGFLTSRLARDRVRIVAVGDITPEALAMLLEQTFGRLPATGPADDAPAAPFRRSNAIEVMRLQNPQSTVVFGAPGIARDDPDFMAANVMNYVLGGGSFSSRLTSEVREKRGLAYGIYTYLQASDRVALLMGGVGTDNRRVKETIEITKDEILRMREGGITEQELADAKAYLTGSYALRFDTNGKIASALLQIQLDGLGIDYVDRRNAEIEAVTLEDVKRVADRLLDPAAFYFVVVGQPEGL